MSVVANNSPVKRSSRLRSRRNSSLGKSPSNILCEQTSNLNFSSSKKKVKKKQQVQSPVRVQQRRSHEVARTPVHVSRHRRTGGGQGKCQGEGQGREVWWDLDTPESKRTREKLTKEYEAMEDSPKTNYVTRTPKLNLIRNRKPSLPSRVNPEKGDAVLADLLNLVADVNNGQDEGEQDDQEELNLQAQSPLRRRSGLEDEESHNTDEEKDMFEDDPFDDDDDMLLLATQAVEDEIMHVAKPDTSSSKPSALTHSNVIANVPTATITTNPSALEQQVTPKKSDATNIDLEEFNDSFDAFLSQVGTPTLQTSNKPVGLAVSSNTNSSLKKIVNPQVAKCQTYDGFDSGNDSFDDLLSQIEIPETSAIPLREEKKDDLERNECSPILKKSKPRFEFKTNNPVGTSSVAKPSFLTSTAASPVNKVKFGKFNTFDSPPRERKKVIAKYRSDSHINKPVCTKEEIERKRKEALAKRQKSLSQKRKL